MRTVAVGHERKFGGGLQADEKLQKIHYTKFSSNVDYNYESVGHFKYLVPTARFRTTEKIKVSFESTMRLWQSLPFFWSFFGASKCNRDFTREYELSVDSYERRSLLMTSEVGENVAFRGCVVNSIEMTVTPNEFVTFSAELFAKDLVRWEPDSDDYQSDARFTEYPVAFSRVEIQFTEDEPGTETKNYLTPIYLATELSLSFGRGLNDKTFKAGQYTRYIQTQGDLTEVNGSMSVMTAGGGEVKNFLQDILIGSAFRGMKITMSSAQNSVLGADKCVELVIEYDDVAITDFDLNSEYSDNYLDFKFDSVGAVTMRVVNNG